MRIFRALFGTFFLIVALLQAQPDPIAQEMIGSALAENQSYLLLQQICDRAGGRLMGSENNHRAAQMLKAALEKLDYFVTLEPFQAPGWVRGKDEVVLLQPLERPLRAVALGYSDRTPTFEAELVYAAHGFAADYQKVDARGKIVLVTQERPPKKKPLLRYEAIDIAARQGARAILFINNKKGGLVLAGVSNFTGKPAPIPAFSLTYEEGKWLQRLAEASVPVRLRITVESHCQPMESFNIVTRLPGKSPQKIVLGAHFDSWDLGQGSIDNGLGSAILFEVARLLKTYSPRNRYTVEFVWFNGEELGLWGSKKYLEQHAQDKILAMFNFDMTGAPTGVNVMGFEEFIPFFEERLQNLRGFDLKRGVINQPWTNSDHQSFLLQGIPTFTLTAHLDEESVKYYHDFADTFDKVNKKYLAEAAGVVAVLVREMANAARLSFRRLSKEETVSLLKKYGLDQRLQRQKQWPFAPTNSAE